MSILPPLSKFYERLIHEQAPNYFESFFNKILCGYRKAPSRQHALFELLTSWQTLLNRGEFVGSILMDFSKAHGCIKHDLLLAKLQAYSFS